MVEAESRTPDLLHAMQTLYQLSYAPKHVYRPSVVRMRNNPSTMVARKLFEALASASPLIGTISMNSQHHGI